MKARRRPQSVYGTLLSKQYETVSELFRLGPDVVTPGTKMPVQTIGNDAEREELIRWLQKVTAPH
jgi:cytochrome c